MIFVDTSAWYAASSPRDTNHLVATRFLGTVRDELCTSDFVIDETLTLFRARSENRHALTFGIQVIDRAFAKIIRLTESDFADAWTIFRTYNDKEWSFTDCTSRVLMERLGIKEAFAFDDHFRQFGTVTVVP